MKPIFNWDKATVFDIEEWRDSPIFPDRYEVSSWGNVRSKPYMKITANRNGPISFLTKSKIVKSWYDNKGYRQICLTKNGQSITRKVHRLVAIAFLDNPDNKPEVNHKDSVKDNNNVLNLEWVTGSENVLHSYEFGCNSNQGERHPRKVLSDEAVREAKRLRALGYTYAKIALTLGYKYCTLYKAIRGDNWGYVE